MLGLYWDNGKTMETTIIYWGYIGIMENEMETTIICWGYIRIMEKTMETTIIYWGYIGIMEKRMDTTIMYWGYTPNPKTLTLHHATPHRQPSSGCSETPCAVRCFCIWEF